MNVVSPCAVCEGVGDEAEECLCGLNMGSEDVVCYECEQPFEVCVCGSL